MKFKRARRALRHSRAGRTMIKAYERLADEYDRLLARAMNAEAKLEAIRLITENEDE